MNSWKKIFDRKSAYIESNPDNLLSFTLFQKVYSDKISYPNFLHITNFIAKKLKIKKNVSILDFGSGNGGLLFYFLNKFNLKKNISIEINNSFIDFQKKFVNETKFIKINFSKPNKDLKKLSKNSVHSVMCNSVFQYFQSDEIVILSLLELLRISKKNIFLYDIKDKKTEQQYKEAVRKRQKLSPLEFDKKYRHTPIKTYDKSFFLKNESINKIAKSIKIYENPKSTLDSKFGYCVLLEKN